MPDITTTQNFTPGQTYTDVELNAIISGAALTPSAITSRSQLSNFDPTGMYLLALAGALRKCSGQQIIDGVGTSPTLITSRTLKTPIAAVDQVLLYDVAGTAMKYGTVGGFSLPATVAAGLGSPQIQFSRATPGALILSPGPIVLASPYTGQVGNAGAIPAPVAGARALILFVVTYSTAAGLMTGFDIQIGRHDGASLYHPTAALSTPPPVSTNGTMTFAVIDPAVLNAISTYRLHMCAATNPMTILDITSAVLIVT